MHSITNKTLTRAVKDYMYSTQKYTEQYWQIATINYIEYKFTSSSTYEHNKAISGLDSRFFSTV